MVPNMLQLQIFMALFQFIKKTAQMMTHHLDLSTLANSRVMRILSHLNSSIAVLEAKFDMMPKSVRRLFL